MRPVRPGLCSKRICNQFPYTDKQNIRGLWGYFENITICVNTDAIFGRQLLEKHKLATFYSNIWSHLKRQTPITYLINRIFLDLIDLTREHSQERKGSLHGSYPVEQNLILPKKENIWL